MASEPPAGPDDVTPGKDSHGGGDGGLQLVHNVAGPLLHLPL